MVATRALRGVRLPSQSCLPTAAAAAAAAVAVGATSQCLTQLAQVTRTTTKSMLTMPRRAGSSFGWLGRDGKQQGGVHAGVHLPNRAMAAPQEVQHAHEVGDEGEGEEPRA